MERYNKVITTHYPVQKFALSPSLCFETLQCVINVTDYQSDSPRFQTSNKPDFVFVL